MKEIVFHEQQFILHENGVLIWPDERLAVVSDLHLEKGSHFAQKGQFLPPHESFETLERLMETLSFSGAERVILLGDSLHDAQSFARLDKRARAQFDVLCNAYEISWVMGNHEKGFVPPDIKAAEEISIKNIIFRHEAESGARGEISGHYHPKAFLKLKGQKISRACFVVDKNRMIMPAFGTLTGGMDVRDEVIAGLLDEDYICYLLGRQKIYSVPSEKL